MILVGDEPYYGRFGFSRTAARGSTIPPPTNPDRLLARALAPDAFDGVAGMVRRWTDDRRRNLLAASALAEQSGKEKVDDQPQRGILHR